MRKAAAAAALLLLAAGCEETPAAEPRPSTKIANPWHERLQALPEQLRRLGVMRAIRDNGKRCRRVEAAAYQEDYRQMAMWVALCDDGRHWALFIAANGDTQVRECTEMQELGLPPCRPIAAPAGGAAGSG